MIKHTIFSRSDTILSDQNACLSSYTIIEEVLVKILLDHLDRTFFVRSYVSLLDLMSVIDLINDPVDQPLFSSDYK